MHKFKLALLMMLAASPTYAWERMQCNGKDHAGNPVSLTAYAKTSYVVIGGMTLQIVGKTADGKGVITEKYINPMNYLVYNAIVPFDQAGINLFQYNAMSQELMAKAVLQCKFFGKMHESKASEEIMNFSAN